MQPTTTHEVGSASNDDTGQKKGKTRPRKRLAVLLIPHKRLAVLLIPCKTLAVLLKPHKELAVLLIPHKGLSVLQIPNKEDEKCHERSQKRNTIF